MTILVHKYGGTSVGSLQRIQTVATHIKKTIDQGHKIVVVVSAMGKHTNQLYEMALSLSKTPPKRELDMLLTTGERVSMALMSIALQELGLSGQSLTGSQSGILTDQTHTNARISKITGERIRKGLEKNHFVIVAGFQGVNPETKEITTLGRGGSDLTAVALAHTLKADSCDIFTDVNGICTADPNIASEAQIIEKMSWDTASELAWSGAKVLHARAAHLCKKFQIPIRLRSSFDFENVGTLIEGNSGMESPIVEAISDKRNLSMVEVLAKSEQRAALEILPWMWNQGHAPQYHVEHLGEDQSLRLNFLIPEEIFDSLKAHVEKIPGASVRKKLQKIAAISIVGQGFSQSPEIVSEASKALSVPLFFVDVRNRCLTLCVRDEDVTLAVKALHKKFFQ